MTTKIDAEETVDLAGDSDKPKCCSAGWCASKWKQMMIVGILLIAILLIVVDYASKSCTAFEKDDDRTLRITCSELGAAALGNATGNGSASALMFVCATEDEPDWEPLPKGAPVHCGKASACTPVGIDNFLTWIGDNIAAGFFVFMLAYVFATVFFIPGSVLTIGAGVVFGAALGLGPGLAVATLAVWVGAVTGASIAFILSRFIFREWVQGLVDKWKYIKVIDQAVQIKGFLTVLLLRFSPAIPFNVFNYLMGATGVGFKEYVAASALGMLPGTIAYVFIGANLGSAAANKSSSCETDNTVTIIILVVGIIATIAAVIVISVVAKKQLANILEQTPDAELDDKKNKA